MQAAHLDNHVSELRAFGLISLEKFVFDNNASSHTRSERHEYHVVIIPSRSEHGFAQSRDVGVVADKRGFVEIGCKFGCQRHFVPPQIAGVIDHAHLARDDSRAAYTHARYFLPLHKRRFGKLADFFRHFADYLFIIFVAARGNARLDYDFAVAVHNTGFYVCASDIDSYVIHTNLLD